MQISAFKLGISLLLETQISVFEILISPIQIQISINYNLNEDICSANGDICIF